MPASTQKGIAHILLLILIVAGIGLGIYLVQNRTNIFPRAASGPVFPRTGFSFQNIPFSFTKKVGLGETVDFDIWASSDFDAANTFAPIITYHPDFLELVKITPSINDSGSSADYFIKRWIEQADIQRNVTKEIRLSGSVPNPGYKTTPDNPGKMATLTFKTKKTGRTDLNFDTYNSAIYRNSDNQNIAGGFFANAIIDITPTSTPSANPVLDSDSDGFTDSQEVFMGTDPNRACGVNAWPPDLNDDTYVNGGDVSALVPYTSGAKPYNKRYDLNLDGKINELDASVIQKYFLKSCNESIVCATTFAKTSTINSNSQITWTYTFADSTKFNKVNFQATPGVAWKVGELKGNPGQALDLSFQAGVNPLVFSAIVSQACQAFTGSFALTNSCGTQMPNFVGVGSALGWGSVCQGVASPTPTPKLPVVDAKRADLYKDSKKPNFVNDQDISVFFTKCAEKGIELFGKPASVQPVCDINNDGTINTPDWSILIKYRNTSV